MVAALLEIPFGAGVNSDIDEKVLQPPYLVSMDNADIDKVGRLSRRPGHFAITHQDLNGIALDPPVRLAKYKDSVVMFTKGATYRYIDTANCWTLTERALGCMPGRVEVARDLQYSLNQCDVAVTSRSALYVWMRNGLITYNVFDLESGAALLTLDNAVSGLAGYQPRALTMGISFVIVYIVNNGGTFEVRESYISSVTGAIASTTTLFTDAHPANHVLDASVDSGAAAAFFVAYLTAAGNIKVAECSTSSVISQHSIAGTGDNAIAVIGTRNENVYVSWSQNGIGLFAAVLPSSLGSVSPVYALGAFDPVHQLTMVRASATSAHVVWELMPSRTSVYRRELSNAGVLGTQYQLYPFNLQSKPWVYDGNTYVNLGFNSQLQGTVYTAQFDTIGGGMRIVASHYPRECGDLHDVSHLSSVAQISTGKFVFADVVKTRLLTGSSAYLMSTAGIDGFIIDFGASLATDRRYLTAEASSDLWLAGCMPSYYDGRAVCEAAFVYSPEGGEMVASKIVGGGALSAGSYEYVAIYDTQDRLGNVMRSVVSLPTTALAVNLNDRIQVTVPQLSRIGRVANLASVVCRIYRPLVNTKGPFYRVDSQLCDISSGNPTAPLTFVDGFSDVTISANEAVYIDGGVLDNVAPPPATSVAIAGDRVFLVCGKDIWYSKVFVSGELPGFSETQVFRAEQGGDIVAVATMDDRPILFKGGSIFTVDGDGFNEKGGGGNYVARPIASDVGCSDARSIVLGPDGLYFKSASGLCLLNRGLQVVSIGRPVYDTVVTDYPIVTSAVILPEKQQILWTVVNAGGSAGRVIVYDYLRKQWGIRVVEGGAAIVSAVAFNGVYYYATAAGVRGSDANTWQDAGVSYAMTARTAWARLSGMQGYQQVRRATFLLDKIGDHDLSITVFADYNGLVLTEAYTWTAAELAQIANERVSIHLRNQKCSAVAFEISDSGANGAGAVISSVVLEVELKRGSARHLLAAGARK